MEWTKIQESLLPSLPQQNWLLNSLHKITSCTCRGKNAVYITPLTRNQSESVSNELARISGYTAITRKQRESDLYYSRIRSLAVLVPFIF